MAVKPIIKLALVGLLVAGVGYVASETEPPPPPPLPDGAAYTIKTGYIGGAEPGQALPLIILLPAEGSNAEDALEGVKTLGPARVVTVEGRYTAFGKYFWIDPKIPLGTEYNAALASELDRLTNVVKALVQDATPARAVLVGHGIAGGFVVGLGLRMPALVRQAWGTGGTVEMAWVPQVAPQQENKGPVLRKLSWREPGYEESVAKKARQRGFDMEVTPLDGKPDDALVLLWLSKNVGPMLATP